MEKSTPSSPNQHQKRINLAIVAVVGQVGCLTLIIVIGAVFLGLWLDSRLGSRPWATIISVAVSIPLSLVAMFVIVRGILKKLKPGLQEKEIDSKDQDELGKEE